MLNKCMLDNFELSDGLKVDLAGGLFSLCSAEIQHLVYAEYCGIFLGAVYLCNPARYTYTYTDRLSVGSSLSFDSPVSPNGYNRDAIGCVASRI